MTPEQENEIKQYVTSGYESLTILAASHVRLLLAEADTLRSALQVAEQRVEELRQAAQTAIASMPIWAPDHQLPTLQAVYDKLKAAIDNSEAK